MLKSFWICGGDYGGVVAFLEKSDVRAHCRANRQSESEMGPKNLNWRGSND